MYLSILVYVLKYLRGLYTSWRGDHGFDSGRGGEEGDRGGVKDDISWRPCDSQPEGDIILNPTKGTFLRRGRFQNQMIVVVKTCIVALYCI